MQSKNSLYFLFLSPLPEVVFYCACVEWEVCWSSATGRGMWLLCGQRREGGKDFLPQNKAKLLITKSTNVLTIRKCWLISLHMEFAQIIKIWEFSNSVPFGHFLFLVLRRKDKCNILSFSPSLCFSAS